MPNCLKCKADLGELSIPFGDDITCPVCDTVMETDYEEGYDNEGDYAYWWPTKIVK